MKYPRKESESDREGESACHHMSTIIGMRKEGQSPHHDQNSSRCSCPSFPFTPRLTMSNGWPTRTAHTPPTPPATRDFMLEVFPLTSAASFAASSSSALVLALLDDGDGEGCVGLRAFGSGEAGVPRVVAGVDVGVQYRMKSCQQPPPYSDCRHCFRGHLISRRQIWGGGQRLGDERRSHHSQVAMGK